MMDYELFKEVVVEKFKEYMTEEYRNYRVETHSVIKVNHTLDALNLVPPVDDGLSISPTIYLNDMYEHYMERGDLQEVLNDATNSMIHAFKNAPNIEAQVDYDLAKDNIVMALVNTGQNKKLLENIPSRPFQDLSVIYRWVVDKNGEDLSSSIVNNNLAEKLGLDEQQLYNVAIENTARLFQPTVKTMGEVIRDMMVGNGMPKEMADIMMGEVPKDNVMYILTNDSGINGAVSMLYENNLHKLAERVEADLYILPSSIHEVIAVSAKMGDPNELAQMVNEINMDQVSLDERLSNQVYHYDKDLRKVSLATDTPNKRLDEMVTETKFICKDKSLAR